MDFTVPIVVLFLVFGIPLRNKAIKEYRKRKKEKEKDNKEQNG